MITFFTCPKALTGHVHVIQRNAIRSWFRVHPNAEVLLCGDEHGVGDFAREVGATHIPDIERNEFGTPLVSSIFEKSIRASTQSVLCYVNADVILFRDLAESVRRLHFRRYLMVCRRQDVEIREVIDFDRVQDDGDRLSSVRRIGVGGDTAIDVFAFPKESLRCEIPAFAIGRPGWDNWFVFNALAEGLRVVDATPSVTALHQVHRFEHVPHARGDGWEGPEADRNRDLAGGWDRLYTIRDASHVLTLDGMLAANAPEHLHRRVERLRKFRPLLFRLLSFWRFRYTLCRWFPRL